MVSLSVVGVAILSSVGIYPVSPTVLVFRTKDFAGKVHENVVVKSLGDRLRVDAFRQTLVFDGKKWYSDGDLPNDAVGAVAFMAPMTPQGDVRVDGSGRPSLLTNVPVGKKTARIEYKYDAIGIAAVNFVLSDGSGYQFRRASADPGSFTPADFEPPRKVEPEAAGRRSGAGARPPDFAAVDRLLAIVIAPPEQLDFERSGAVGRFQPSPR